MSPNPIVKGNCPIERLECRDEGPLRVAPLVCCFIEACDGVGISDQHRLEARDVAAVHGGPEPRSSDDGQEGRPSRGLPALPDGGLVAGGVDYQTALVPQEAPTTDPAVTRVGNQG